MTLQQFQKLLNKISPKLKLRVKHSGDVIGLFAGISGKSGYITRMSKGELHLNGYRWMVPDANGNMVQGPIKKRGRLTVINLLRSYGWITNHYQRTMLSYGVEYPEEVLKGRAGKNQYSKL